MSAKRQPKQAGNVDPMQAAYAVAEGLAVSAVRTWSIRGNEVSDRRADNIDAVRLAASKAAGRRDAIKELYRLINEHVTERATNIELSDACVSLLVEGTEAGYLYGLAMGLALSKGGAR